MQQPHRSMGIPRAIGAMFAEDIGQAAREISQMFQRDSAIFNKGNRFALTPHRHHDIQPLGSHPPDAGLELWVFGFDHPAFGFARIIPMKAQIGHQFPQGGQAAAVFIRGFSKFNQQ